MTLAVRADSPFRTVLAVASAASAISVAVIALLVAPKCALAAEPDKNACADAYRNAQTQRRSGDLQHARESLLSCASERCPAVLHPDCMRWLAEVEAATPSLALAAKGVDGRDLIDVRVSIDGKPLAAQLDGKAVPVDPGPHTLRFEHSDGPPIEQPIVVREGEKSRVVAVSWAKAPVQLFADTGPPPPPPRKGPPMATWIFGGVGIAGVATFAALGLAGLQRRSALERDCYGACDQTRVDSIHRQFVAADIALGIGAASLGVATVLLLLHGGDKTDKKPKDSGAAGLLASWKPPPIAIHVSIKPGGGTAGVAGRF